MPAHRHVPEWLSATGSWTRLKALDGPIECDARPNQLDEGDIRLIRQALSQRECRYV